MIILYKYEYEIMKINEYNSNENDNLFNEYL